MRQLPAERRSARRAALVVLALLATPSCARQAPPPAPAQTPAEGAETKSPWPARFAEDVLSAKGVVRALPDTIDAWTVWRPDDSPLHPAPIDREDARALLDAARVPDEAVEFEGPGATIAHLFERAEGDDADAGARFYVWVSARARAGTDDPPRVERTWFVLLEPVVPRDEPGLIVLLPGMFGTPEAVIDGLAAGMRARGWHVLRMLSHPSRFTERKAFHVAHGQDPARAAGEIVPEFDDRAAECAYAVEGVCAELARTRPGVPVDRRVAVGLSGGGMVLPCVVSREAGAYRGAVVVGGGAGFVEIAIRSNYTDWIDALRVTWDEAATPEEESAFLAACLEASVFDGYTCARALEGKPVLVLHAPGDRAVPASCGDLLWERLGRPERWTSPGGHEGLFLAYLPLRAGAVLDWIESHVPMESRGGID